MIIKLRKYLILTALTMIISSCATVKEIPVQTVEKVVYRDSLVYVKDTIRVEIPKEVVKEVIPQIDTSYLRTSYAESYAYVDTVERRLHHTLSQRGEVEVKFDTIVKVQYVDRIVERDVPIEVEVIKYKRDTLFWGLLAWASFCVVAVILSILRRLKVF